MLAGTLEPLSGVKFGRWMCQILLEQAVMVTHARCRLTAASLKPPAAGSPSPPPSVEFKVCFCGTHEGMSNPGLGDIHTAVCSGRLLSSTLLWSLTVTTCMGLGRWKVPPLQLASWDWVGSGSFPASTLPVGVLIPHPGGPGDTWRGWGHG